MSKAIKSLEKDIRDIINDKGRGDLTKRFESTSRVSGLTKGLNILMSVMDNLVYKLKSAARDSRDNLSILNDKGKDVKDASGVINAELKDMGVRMENLREAVAQTSTKSREVSDSSEKIAGEIENQAAAVEESSAAVTEMTASIRSITGSTSERFALIGHLKETAEASRKKIQENERIIGQVASQADQIQSFIGIIDNIAAQTNLLAMNAAIEAAHAGDAGKGFSVVADEVRKLAESTSANAKSIASTMNEILGGIEGARELSQDVSRSYGEIVEDVDKFSESVSEVSSGLTELSSGTGEIDKALAELSSITSDVEQSAKIISDNSSAILQSMDKVGEISDENTRFVERIEEQVQKSDETISEFSRICGSSIGDIDSLLKQVEQYAITDLGQLKSGDGQPLIIWSSFEKEIPPRPANPSSFPKMDARHWYDSEYTGFGIKKAPPIPSPCDGPEGKSVAVFIPGKHPYYEAYKLGMGKIAKLMGLKLDISEGDWTAGPQKVFFDKVMKGKFDMVVCIAADINSFGDQIKKAYEKGLPVIVSQAAPLQDTFKYIVSYTGFDDWGTHRLFARHFADRLGKKGRYGIIGHIPGSGQHNARCYGFATEIASYAPEMELIDIGVTNLEEEKTAVLIRQWLDKYGDELKGIFAADSLNPLKGIIKTLEKAGRSDVAVYTTGVNQYSLDMCKVNKCHGIRWESAEADGALALETGCNWFSGLVVEPVKYLPYHCVTKKDANDYYPAQW